MNIEEIREYCISKKAVSENFPFDDKTLVFKVGSKMFALVGLDNNFINLKCEPELAIERREEFEEITAGYHMNKKHRNSVYYTKGLPFSFVKEMIDESYNLVFNSLTKKEREQINNL
jgi:predicted DNA-binding protein (MmcQ/YjbR family)